MRQRLLRLSLCSRLALCQYRLALCQYRLAFEPAVYHAA